VDELDEGGQDTGQSGGAAHHVVGDAGELGDERGMASSGSTRVEKVPRHSPPRNLAAAISVRAQVSGPNPGGLDVDDAESHVVERKTEIVGRGRRREPWPERTYEGVRCRG
jgi:hypothetical protein